MISELAASFPAYTEHRPRVPTYCVTPELPGTIHRFFDTSPFSPSGRYLALARLREEHRLPRPGDVADVVVVDLETGETNLVAETRGWDTQLGAQVQWGADDRSLFYNDLDTRDWTPFGVLIDPLGSERRRLDGTVYMVSPDGKWAVSPCLLRTSATQSGYGVRVPRRRIPVNRGASPRDGIYITNTVTGQTRLLVSLARIVREASPPFDLDAYRQGDFYGFHAKWNPQGTRLMFVVRWVPRSYGPRWLRLKRRRALKHVITMNADGSNIHVAVPAPMWSRGGHHPNWCPDGEHVLMNLNMDGDGLRFVKARYDGSHYETLAPTIRGSGHPTLHPGATHILTDAYLGEPLAFADGSVPLRWIDVRTSSETTLVRIHTRPNSARATGALRVDPHPAWDRDYRRIAFNACPGGRRRVFVADLRECLETARAGTLALAPGE